jgi:hypothetical protein
MIPLHIFQDLGAPIERKPSASTICKFVAEGYHVTPHEEHPFQAALGCICIPD